MAYKDIVVFVDPSPASMHRLRIAAGLTQRYAAHLIGVYVVPGDMDDRASDEYVRGERGVRAVLERHRAAEQTRRRPGRLGNSQISSSATKYRLSSG